MNTPAAQVTTTRARIARIPHISTATPEPYRLRSPWSEDIGHIEIGPPELARATDTVLIGPAGVASVPPVTVAMRLGRD